MSFVRLLLPLIGLGLSGWAGTAPAADVPFAQEYHEAFPLPGGAACNDVRCVAATPDGIAAGTAAGLFVLSGGAWEERPAMGPIYDLAWDVVNSRLLIGAWNGLHALGESGDLSTLIEGTPVTVVLVPGEEALALGPEGYWRVDRASVTPIAADGVSRNRRAAASDGERLWLATGMGLYQLGDSNTLYQSADDIVSSDVRDVAVDNEGRVWAGSLGGITVYQGDRRMGQFTPAEGLPSVNVQSIARGPDGRMWVGLAEGVARWDGRSWSLRHSKRWLVNDDVRDIAFDADGTAWIATAGGVSAIRQKQMTLAEKAAYFQEVTMKRHVRAPFFVEKCVLPVTGDLSKWEPTDDDNDGSYTAQQMLAESYRYAVTKAPDARENARRMFQTMVQLQTITGTDGFIARTFVPAHWEHLHDGNRTYTPEERAEELVSDPRYKPVEERWRPSADGKWLWKGDTSSDEMVGHYFWFHMYHDLMADDEEKMILRDLVTRVTDHLIANNYTLVDIDGTHTRWGVWTPDRLKNDPDWRAERCINATEICSFLKAAFHVTGNERYQVEYLKLLHDHGYLDYIREAKTFAPAWRTHIDDELLAMTWPALFKFETDPALLAAFRDGLDGWYEGVRPEQNPYFNFIYALCTGQDPQREDSLFFLRDTPLDLISWTIDNGWREDLDIVRSPILEFQSTSRLLPPSERTVVRWDKNHWRTIQGEGGQTEWAPMFWLLPYWMGRYHGYIAAP